MSSLWFPSANIPDAIAESKRLSRLFLVYISGEDDASQKMDEMWDDERVLSLCRTTCVAIKLQADSDSCKQFSAIYPVLTIPSAYFIDSTGQIVEALVAQSATDEFVSKIDVVTKPYRRVAEDTSHVQPHEDKPGSSKTTEVVESGPSTSGEKETKVDDAKKPGRRRKTADERFEDEEKEETQHEKERREWGKNLQKLKEAQREAKLKQDIEERKRNKLEEQAARERVRRQIEQDKLDRAARFKQEKDEKMQAAAQAQSVKDEEKNKERDRQREERNLRARLQFRLPDGSSLIETFDSTDVFQSAAEFIVRQNLSGCSSAQSFNLAVAFPRRTIPLSEYSRTFADLDLAPSASLVVLPQQTTDISPSELTSGGFSSILLFILMIPVRFLMFLWSFIAGQPSNQRAEASAVHGGTFSSDVQRSNQPGTGDSPPEVRRRRNMTRLRDVKGDDDDNATWNGNSTQQM